MGVAFVGAALVRVALVRVALVAVALVAAAFFPPAILVALSESLPGTSAVAQRNDNRPPGHSPQVCNGYFRGGKDISAPKTAQSLSEFRLIDEPDSVEHWSMQNQVCPKNYAIYSLMVPGAAETKELGATIPVTGQCCRLPADDILTNDSILAFEACPENFVATGGSSVANCTECRKVIHCTRINTERYQLGSQVNGAFWGFRAGYWRNESILFRREIPAAIRYGAGRVNRWAWQAGGCLAFPFGGLLTGKQTRWCEDFVFQPLEFKGLPGDPSAGTPVEMFAECDSIDNEFQTSAACLRRFP